MVAGDALPSGKQCWRNWSTSSSGRGTTAIKPGGEMPSRSRTSDVPCGGFFISRPKPITLASAEQFTLTLMSDLHIGARNVDYGLIEHELAEAKKHGDRVNINGDVFDMILTQDVKRFRADCVHPRLEGRSDQVQAGVEWGIEILGPYADIIDMVGLGNHEEAVTKYHGVDVLKLLVYELRRLRKKSSHIIHYGGYTGYIDYRLGYANKSYRYQIYYHHGSGGEAPVTKGMIDLHRKSWVIADLIWLGHKHNRLAADGPVLRCPLRGYEPEVVDVRKVMTGAYFDTYHGQSQDSVEEHGRITNYAADKGLAPQGKGGARVEVGMSGRGLKVKVIQ